MTRARAGLALVPEDRQRQGLLFNLTIRHNLVLPRAAKTGVTRIDDARGARRSPTRRFARWRFKTPSVDALPDTLSGGNQQKVVAAKWLATRRGCSCSTSRRRASTSARSSRSTTSSARARPSGMACLVVSSDLPEVLALADRILVMREGRVRGELAGRDATEETVMQLATHEVEAHA